MAKNYEFTHILALPMQENDADARNIGQYFIRLAQQAWIEEEGFSGKRPFGNSGWQSEVIQAFIKHEVIDGHLDSDGYLESYDESELDRIITRLFEILLKVDWANVQEYNEPEDWYVVYLDLTSDGFPRLVDAFRKGLTEEAAKEYAEELNSDADDTHWTAYHIPKES